jgi:nucleoid DNA-binding protein
MKKNDIIQNVCEKTGFTKKDIEIIYDNIFEEIMEGLKNDKKVMISGFGTFEMKIRKGRSLSNPRTGEEVVVPDKPRVSFKSGKDLKDIL